MSTGEKTGGNVSYYVVDVNNPKRLAPYTAEAEDIIEALGMNFAEGNAFKAIWRSCAARTLGLRKGDMDVYGIYDAEKVVYYGGRMLAQRKRLAEQAADAKTANGSLIEFKTGHVSSDVAQAQFKQYADAMAQGIDVVPAPLDPKDAWIGVDLDGTLAHDDGWKGPQHIGKPIPAMLHRVQGWIENGQRVKIFTARASIPEQIQYVQKWLRDVGLGNLEVTNVKDFNMLTLWDDRAVQVCANTGERVGRDQRDIASDPEGLLVVQPGQALKAYKPKVWSQETRREAARDVVNSLPLGAAQYRAELEHRISALIRLIQEDDGSRSPHDVINCTAGG